MSVASLSARQPQPPASSDSVRVMVVDDSAVVRGLVTRWVNEDEALQVVASQSNGKMAVDQINIHKPDIVVLDIEMPVMDGLTALPELLKACPGVKVIMASTLTRRNAEISLKALSLGAVDYIPKPEGNRGVTTSKDFRIDLINKIKAVCPAKIRRFETNKKAQSADAQSGAPLRPQAVVEKEKAVTKSVMFQQSDDIALRSFSNVTPRILAVGSSTGGPQALIKFFESIKASITHVPVVLTQHMPATFTTILAEHIARTTGGRAKEGEHQEPLAAGTVYVAPGGKHMTLTGEKMSPVIKLDDGPDVNFCKPAVDPLFESVSALFGPATLGVVLTGMGQDGAAGAKVIADHGGSIIAQDQETSVVWGMPGATAKIGACSAILPLDKIGPKVIQLLKGGAV